MHVRAADGSIRGGKHTNTKKKKTVRNTLQNLID